MGNGGEVTAPAIDWKKLLGEFLRKLGLVERDFTGKLILNFSQGSLCEAEKNEKIK